MASAAAARDGRPSARRAAVARPQPAMPRARRVAQYLTRNPKRIGGHGRQAPLTPLITPIAIAAGPGCLLIMVEPDMGTTLVIAFTIAALLIAAGMPLRQLLLLGAVAAGIVLLFVLA